MTGHKTPQLGTAFPVVAIVLITTGSQHAEAEAKTEFGAVDLAVTPRQVEFRPPPYRTDGQDTPRGGIVADDRGPARDFRHALLLNAWLEPEANAVTSP